MPLVKRNAGVQDYTNNTDGWDLTGGNTQRRKLTYLGGDATIEAAGNAVITFPSTTSTLMPEPDWYGNLYGAYGRCDPQQLIRMASMAGVVSPTQTNISNTVARIAYFRPPANITVNKFRFFGVGATTGFRTAIYNGDTLARLTAELAITTAAQTWGSVGDNLNLTLVKNQLYFIAVSVIATGTTAGILAMSATNAATTGQIGVLPKSWPGNLGVDLGYMDGAFAQFAVTSGALPTTAPTIAAPAVWTGGMPLIFLDNNNA
jgi:hypothetical protein